MKPLKISYSKLVVIIAVFLFLIGLLIAVVKTNSATKRQKELEEPLLSAIEDCLTVCDKVYAKMEIPDDTTYNIHKSNVNKAEDITAKYYAALTMMDYTELTYTNYRTTSANEYYEQDPNDYDANKNQKEINEIVGEFTQARVKLEKAQENYSLIKESK